MLRPGRQLCPSADTWSCARSLNLACQGSLCVLEPEAHPRAGAGAFGDCLKMEKPTKRYPVSIRVFLMAP